MGKNELFFVFSVVLCGSVAAGGVTYGGITVNGVKCGQKTCKISEYCSNVDNSCQDCSVACNTSSNNYEEIICEKQCQDYLHDIRYVRKTGSNDENLRGTVERLSRMVTITLTLVIFMLIVMACHLCFQLYRWKIKKNITLEGIRNKFFKKNDSPRNSPETPDNKKRDLRLEMPSPTINSDHSPITVTTSIDRRPAEDSTLDYAYDNPAMTKSQNSPF